MTRARSIPAERLELGIDVFNQSLATYFTDRWRLRLLVPIVAVAGIMFGVGASSIRIRYI